MNLEKSKLAIQSTVTFDPNTQTGSMLSGTYSDINTLTVQETLQPGRQYLITDRGDTGLIVKADTISTFSTNAEVGFLNADWQASGDYTSIQGYVSYTTLLGGNFTPGNIIKVNDSSANELIITHDFPSSSPKYLIMTSTNGNIVLNDTLIEYDSAGVTPTGVTAVAITGVYGAILGMWNGTKGGFKYNAGVNTPFSVGDTITCSTNWSAVVLTDDGSNLTFNLLDGRTPVSTDIFNSGLKIATVNSSTTFTFKPALVDIVIWFDGTRWSHYQKITRTNSTKTAPDLDNVNWELVSPDVLKGYAEQWINCEYDFLNDTITTLFPIQANAVNKVQGTYNKFPFGWDNINNTEINVKNLTIQKPAFNLANTIIKNGCTISITEFDGDIDACVIEPNSAVTGNGSIGSCYFGASSTVSGCAALYGSTFGPLSTVTGNGYSLTACYVDNGQNISLTNNHTSESIINSVMTP